MKNKFSVLMSSLFCAFLGGVLLVSTVLPDLDFSPLENRNLAKPPVLSLENLHSGEFMSQAEKYTSDHIVGRDFWVAMKAWSERLTGKQENNGVYFGEKDTLINRVDTPDMDKLLENLDHINTMASKVDVPVSFGIIPSSAAVWRDRLPAGAPTADELAIIEQLYANADMPTLDLAGMLLQHAGEDIFYRTDHHWTSLGALYGANAMFSHLGLKELAPEDYHPELVSDSFYGTTFSSSGVRWVEADQMWTYIPEEGVEVTAYPNGKPEAGEMYVEEHLEKKDKYSFFMGGNQPLCVLKTEKNDGPKVLVIRDSYSDALAPFLTENFSEVHLFDVRYNLTPISAYVAQNDIDQVVVLYSFSNFVQGQNFFALGR